MLTIDEALKIVLSHVPNRRVEQVSFRGSQGRVLAQDVLATSDVPSFPRATMDGYALRAEDVCSAPRTLRLVGEIRAGGGVTVPVGPQEAAAIMTGAPVPDGADAVQAVELTERPIEKKVVRILRPVTAGENIVPVGKEARLGEVVLHSGQVVGSAELAVLATFGCDLIVVFARPRVALVATGDELVEMGDSPGRDQIRNSNAHSITGQLRSLGIEAEYLGIARDDKDDLRRFLKEGLSRDVLILTGGVSMGKYDFVKEVFLDLGLEILFTQVAMKPGKPTVFARTRDTVVFGLPGNPVSTFVAFENFVRPLVGRMCGYASPELPRIRGELLRDMKQKPGRTAFLPAWVAQGDHGWTIDPLGWKGSGDIIGFAQANATVVFPGDKERMHVGETVEAMLLPDYSLRCRS